MRNLNSSLSQQASPLAVVIVQGNKALTSPRCALVKSTVSLGSGTIDEPMLAVGEKILALTLDKKLRIKPSLML